MTDLTGLTRQDCPTACRHDSCVLAGGRPFCWHVCKSGVPESFARDPEIQRIQAEARELLGVKKHILQGATS